MLSDRPAAFTLATASSSCCLLTVSPVHAHPVRCMAACLSREATRSVPQGLTQHCHSPACSGVLDGVLAGACFSTPAHGPHIQQCNLSRWRAHLNRMDSHRSPSAANLQYTVRLLDACLLYEGVQLLKLRMLQRPPCAAAAE